MDGAVFLKRLGAKGPPGTRGPFLQKEELQAPVSRRVPQLFTFSPPQFLGEAPEQPP